MQEVIREMFYALALLSGVALSYMISVNGGLSDAFGVFPAACIIHIIGSLFALILCSLKKEKYQHGIGQPLWMYAGGAVGVLTTVFSNVVVGKISITAILALMLFGQTAASLVIDTAGLFRMKKYPLKRYAFFGLAVSCSGIFLMLTDSAIKEKTAVCFSFLAGITAVISRTINASLTQKTDALLASLFNHLVGLPITAGIAAAVIISRQFHPLIESLIVSIEVRNFVSKKASEFPHAALNNISFWLWIESAFM